MQPVLTEILATALFGCAVLHTFSVHWIRGLAQRFPPGSVGENLLHLLGEVEVVFGLWAAILVGAIAALEGTERATRYLEGLNFTEPAFVFVIMTIAASRPVIELATRCIAAVGRLLPLREDLSFYAVALVLGPLLGSFITEPAAMTVTAVLLKNRYYDRGISSRLMYATLGLLFVNVSIGGTLTPFAAPPVLMVAGKWGWGFGHMAGEFGWKAAVAVVACTVATTVVFRRELSALPAASGHARAGEAPTRPVPLWLMAAHVVFLAVVVLSAHHVVVFLGAFLFFLGLAAVTEEYQDPLRLREALLVGFFLAGLVVLGGLQRWWLQPLLAQLDVVPLYLGTAALTAITDNAALTYLGSQVLDLTEAARYALLSGAVVGGGLTVIANAPNPAGLGILGPSFGARGVSPLGLLVSALGPTAVALAAFWWLPSV